jgi:hypothetical protein
MRNSTRAGAALLSALAFTGVTAVSASAAEPGTDTTTVTVDVKGGTLDIAVPADALTFALTEPGQVATGELTGITVNDTRAATVGWVASVNIEEFTSETVAAAIPAENFTYTASNTTVKTGNSTVVAAPSAVAGGPSASAVQTATAVVGNNSATWGATVELLIPTQALAANYTATLTHSVL